MNRRISVALLAVTLLLNSCGAGTPFPPTSTATLTSTPTRTVTLKNPPSSTVTLLPMPPDEATKTIFDATIANVCPTTTPAVADKGNTTVLADTLILREFAGLYVDNTGTMGTKLIVNCDDTFGIATWYDTGDILYDAGTVSVQNSQLEFKSYRVDYPRFYATFIPVRWGQRKYLVDPDLVDLFCKTTRSTEVYGEPRGENDFGLTLLRVGDGNLVVSEFPILPSGEKVCP